MAAAAIVVVIGGKERPYPGLLQWKLSLSLAAALLVLAACFLIPPVAGRLTGPLTLLIVPLQVDGLLVFLGESSWRGWRSANLGAALACVVSAAAAPFSQLAAEGGLFWNSAANAVESAIGLIILMRAVRPTAVPAIQVIGACFTLDILIDLVQCVAFAAPTLSSTGLRASVLSVATMFATVILLLKAFGIIAAKNQRTESELRVLSRDLEYQASTDPLTRLRNRRSFYELGHAMVALALRHHRPLTALMIDIDRFKEINDTRGHATGDLVLVSVAETLNRMLRTSDLIGRVGGEEFAILLVETGQRSAELTAERLRRGISALRGSGGGFEGLSVSIGLAPLTSDAIDLDSLLQAADKALYRAKREGRNRWVAAA